MSYVQTLGMTVLEASPSLTRVALTVSAAGLNMHGTAHGGLVFSLADEAFAVISNLEAQAVAAETHLIRIPLNSCTVGKAPPVHP
ncbi:hotdog fold thioesterase [Deinococcus sp. VB142]|uniref:Hotdog fold thioesterase n=1 Tax=Deinococcus sp. VB142 TaxID=3112952 RepID=A0AAU6PZG6_9DEIO